MVGRDYHHVRQPVARVSGKAIGGGSIGDAECRIRGVGCGAEAMSETDLPTSAGTSQEADITAALGPRPVVLVGMMGAGKSTIGRRLATRLRLPFVDADAEIEAAHAGMTIPEIFATHGELYFRDGEVRVIARLLDGGPSVLATGGGAFMREETRGRIRDKAVSIWLKVDADIIMRRVKRRVDRPLLQTADPAATVARLIEERHPIYQQADLTIASRDVPHEKIVEECIAALHDHLSEPCNGTR
jgi:shikimate kinase